MNDNLLQLGVGGIFAVLIIKEVLNFISKRNNEPISNEISNLIGAITRTQEAQTEHLKTVVKVLYDVLDIVKKTYDMHDQKDSDGIYRWYVKKSLEKAVSKLESSVTRQSEIFKEVIRVTDKKSINPS